MHEKTRDAETNRLTSSCPCPFWRAVNRLGAPVPSTSQPQPFSYWKRSSLPPVPVSSPPESSSLPGASVWAAQTSREAWDHEGKRGVNIRQTPSNIFSKKLFYANIHPHLFLLFFQLCLCFLYLVDKHLSHFLLFALQVYEELLPLGFVGLLKAEDMGQSNVKLS